MACYQKVLCPHCGSDHIIKAGTSAKGEQRYRCKNPDCTLVTFMQAYCYKAYEHGVKARIVDMALNGSGVRDTARVLKVSRNTVMGTIKKSLPYSHDQSEFSRQRPPKRAYSQGGACLRRSGTG